jgi:hypothetical protein
MELNYEILAVTGTRGQVLVLVLILVLLYAAPHSEAAQSPTLLAHLAHGDRTVGPTAPAGSPPPG